MATTKSSRSKGSKTASSVAAAPRRARGLRSVIIQALGRDPSEVAKRGGTCGAGGHSPGVCGPLRSLVALRTSLANTPAPAGCDRPRGLEREAAAGHGPQALFYPAFTIQEIIRPPGGAPRRG